MNPSDMNDDTEHFDLDLGELGAGPAHRPLEDRLAAGRRALRRRRAGTGLASVAVIAVIGTTFALVSGPGSPLGADDSTSVADGGPDAPAPTDEMCSVPGAPGGGTSGYTGSGTTRSVPALPGEPGDPQLSHDSVEAPDVPDDPDAPDAADAADAPDATAAPDATGSGGGTDPGAEVTEAPYPGVPGDTDPSALPVEPVPDLVCCASVPVPAEPGLEEPLPPVGTMEPGTAEPDREGQESGLGSGSGTSRGTDDDAEPDPAGDAPTASVAPMPGSADDGSGLLVDCAGFPDEGVSSSGTGWGSADGQLGGTYVGPLGQDESATRLDAGQLADLTSDGELVLADGVELTDRVENPLGLEDPDHSLAVAVTDGDDATTWLLLTFDKLGKDCGEWSFTSTPAEEGSTLQEWVDDTSVGSGPYASDRPTCVGPAGAGSGSVGKP